MFENQQGLSLAELLVVTGIIMVLTAAVVPNWNRGGNRLKVTRSAYQVGQDIRRAQELTLAAVECEECRDCDSDDSPTRGYGVRFDLDRPHQYILFGDCDRGINTLGEYDGDGERKETSRLEEGVEIMDIVEPGGNKLDLTYKPPKPKVEIRNAFGDTSDRAEIIIGTSNYCKRIIANKVGLVNIQDMTNCP